MNKIYTQKDLEDFYYKLFIKYNIKSIEEFEKAISNKTIPEEELLIKLEDLVSKDLQEKIAKATRNHQPKQNQSSIQTLHS